MMIEDVMYYILIFLVDFFYKYFDIFLHVGLMQGAKLSSPFAILLATR
jgi:hypothetical protein